MKNSNDFTNTARQRGGANMFTPLRCVRKIRKKTLHPAQRLTSCYLGLSEKCGIYAAPAEEVRHAVV